MNEEISIRVKEIDAGEMTVAELRKYIETMPENTILNISFKEESAHV